MKVQGGRQGERMEEGGKVGRWRESERERERKEASDFSSVTDGFHLTASLPRCLHKKTSENVFLSIWDFASM